MDRRRIGGAVEAVRQRAHRPDYQIVLYVGLLMLLGLITMYAIGPQRAQVLNASYGTDAYTGMYFVVKQAISLAISLTAFIVMAFLPFSLLRRYAGSLLVAGLGASALLVLTGNLLHIDQIAQCTLGACRWFELGPFGTFQPAELLKFGFLIFMARLLADKIAAGKLNDWEETIMPVLILTAIVLGFIVIFQKDLGTGISTVAIVASMLMVAGVSRKIGLRLVGIGAAAGLVAIIIAPHRIARVLTFFQSNDTSMLTNPDGASYHILQAKIAIGTGNWFGLGIGNSVQSTGYLPEAINDSVFAILGEIFGFVGLVGILILFTLLVFRILRVADRLREPWMQLVAAGVFGWVVSHIVLNIASMVGVFPLTGITLPLLSFGGTSMIFIAAAIGIVFGMSRFTSFQPVTEETSHANTMRGRGIGRTRYAGRRRS
ncbi:MAG TPA: FtsW/RodA/SpoVE family cell cycle protein [Patescibacteria group bacterium]|nr:FtsW/RodA/SpoVE family cell cycle protein [Patescibacteria group bacterium]